ncbi:MAG TPA: hypothetical protein VMZ33_04175, partial [Candidatus Limnocylindrales bacterium]|nr:hypothetical protein [Candidatus Limnocylindrales bacterium]
MDEDTERLLRGTADKALDYLRSLPDRHVGAREDARTIASRIGGPLPEASEDAAAVLDRMIRDVDPGIVAAAGPRYFGFVIGGTLPASLAADWMTAAWDQNTAVHALSPAGAAAEQVAGEWMLDLLGLPAGWSTGLPTGAGLG